MDETNKRIHQRKAMQRKYKFNIRVEMKTINTKVTWLSQRQLIFGGKN